jgi:hypothetical protein
VCDVTRRPISYSDVCRRTEEKMQIPMETTFMDYKVVVALIALCAELSSHAIASAIVRKPSPPSTPLSTAIPNEPGAAISIEKSEAEVS